MLSQAVTHAPTIAEFRAMEVRQKLILHRLSRVQTALSTLQGYVSEVRHALQQQNALLHKVELHIDNMNDKYLVGL